MMDVIMWLSLLFFFSGIALAVLIYNIGLWGDLMDRFIRWIKRQPRRLR